MKLRDRTKQIPPRRTAAKFTALRPRLPMRPRKSVCGSVGVWLHPQYPTPNKLSLVEEVAQQIVHAVLIQPLPVFKLKRTAKFLGQFRIQVVRDFLQRKDVALQ